MLTAKYHDEIKLLVIRLEGELSFREFNHELGTEILKLYEKHATNDRINRLIDLRRAVLRLSGDDVHALAQSASKVDKKVYGGKAALVATSDLIFGILRQFEMHGSDLDVKRSVFRTPAEALGWLGVDPKLAESLCPGGAAEEFRA